MGSHWKQEDEIDLVRCLLHTQGPIVFYLVLIFHTSSCCYCSKHSDLSLKCLSCHSKTLMPTIAAILNFLEAPFSLSYITSFVSRPISRTGDCPSMYSTSRSTRQGFSVQSAAINSAVSNETYQHRKFIALYYCSRRHLLVARPTVAQHELTKPLEYRFC